jgi:hypothetical protein
MTTRVVATITASIFAVLIATTGFTCTTICLVEKDRLSSPNNYDAWASEGLILVNKRGMSKKGGPRARAGALPVFFFVRDRNGAKLAQWCSKHLASYD